MCEINALLGMHLGRPPYLNAVLLLGVSYARSLLLPAAAAPATAAFSVIPPSFPTVCNSSSTLSLVYAVNSTTPAVVTMGSNNPVLCTINGQANVTRE